MKEERCEKPQAAVSSRGKVFMTCEGRELAFVLILALFCFIALFAFQHSVFIKLGPPAVRGTLLKCTFTLIYFWQKYGIKKFYWR